MLGVNFSQSKPFLRAKIYAEINRCGQSNHAATLHDR